jgi:hypothetical protein
MLCLTEKSNCVLINCGHSNICFNCTMRLAIKNKEFGKPIICHLCRNEIQYALKIDISCLDNKPIDKEFNAVKILSYVDLRMNNNTSSLNR